MKPRLVFHKIKHISGSFIIVINYNQLSRTGTDYPSGFSNPYRVTTKFLTGQNMIGQSIYKISVIMKNVGSLTSQVVTVGIWDSLGNLKTSGTLVGSSISASYTQYDFTVTPYILAANDHVGMEFGLQGNSSLHPDLRGDTNAATTNTETYNWTASAVPGSAVSPAGLAIGLNL